MAVKTLLSQTGVAGSTGAITSFPGSDDVRTVQFNPQVGIGFTGTAVVEGSYAPAPGNNDFVVLATVTFTGHTSNLSLDIDSDAPWVRVRLSAASVGAVAVFGDSRLGAISGSQGSTPATATVDSSLRVAGTGTGFSINSPVVPSITTDDVIYAGNFAQTLTDVLDGTNGASGKQDKIGTGVITASEADVNILTGAASAGLVAADMTKLADVTVTATEINRVSGVTSNIQTQLNTLSSGKADTSTVPANKAWVDAFFDSNPGSLNVSDLTAFTGVTASAADINLLDGASGQVTLSDFVKLGDITASASQINALNGFTGSSTDLNKIVGLSASNADLDTIAGLAGNGVSSTELAFLSGLTENVQDALDLLPSLVGLTASVNDLNTLTGIFSGANGYPAQITVTEISYLNGVTSNIQTQLDGKRSIGVAIGIAEISGSSITTTELNYLQGATSNIQAQINTINATAITPSGGTFTGAITVAAGSAASPSVRFSAALTTGLYRFGATGYGVAVGGTRFLSADGTDFVVGTGGSNGSPLLKGVGFASTDPAYSFNGDSNTGIYWISADAMGIAAGGTAMATFNGTTNQIVLGGAASENNAVTISGVFGGEKLLGSATIDVGSGSATGQTTLYTVPTGRSALITRIYFRVAAVTGSTNNDFVVNVGFGGSFDEILDNTNNATVFNPGGYAFDTVGQIMPVGVGDNTFPAVSGSSGADYQMLTAAAVLKADVASLDTGASVFSMTVYVMGVEV